MKITTDVPEEIKEVAKENIEESGPEFEYLGKYEGGDYYAKVEKGFVGFPLIFVFKDGKARELIGNESFEIDDYFAKMRE